MKTKAIGRIIIITLVGFLSCNEPKTVITDVVHRDGSVTRKIEMKSSERKFELSNIQVPLDNSWKISDSVEVSAKGDTLWVKRAEKLFAGIEEINYDYSNDSSANRSVKRSVEFKKRFRWFNTVYYFSEKIDKQVSFGYPLQGFLDKEELEFFYSPDFMTESMKSGTDSLKYRALEDTINKKTDKWFFRNAVAGWTFYFSDLTKNRGDSAITAESLKKKEPVFLEILEREELKFDSLWQTGQILKELIGEPGSVIYRSEADSALTLTTENLLFDFKEYTQRIRMPGRLIGTNGYRDSTSNLIWTVRSDYFVTEPFIMWAESKTSNTWTRAITGFFLLFVGAGFLARYIRK
jgi:hypothetical protein